MCIVDDVTDLRYLTGAALSRRLGVEPNSLSNWRRRYPPDSDILPTPPPDAWTVTGRGDVPLWLVSSEADWRAWQASRYEKLYAWRRRTMIGSGS